MVILHSRDIFSPCWLAKSCTAYAQCALSALFLTVEHFSYGIDVSERQLAVLSDPGELRNSMTFNHLVWHYNTQGPVLVLVHSPLMVPGLGCYLDGEQVVCQAESYSVVISKSASKQESLLSLAKLPTRMAAGSCTVTILQCQWLLQCYNHSCATAEGNKP